MSRPAGDLALPGPWSYRTDFVFPNAPLGSFGEEAKLRLRRGGRQPGFTILTSDPFAKSNNFGFRPGLS